MKILLPENIKDITLEQYQQYVKILEKELTSQELKKELISNFSNLPYNQIDNVSQKDIESMYLQITTALNQDVEFTNRFIMNGVEYGFIPNFDLISGAEWVDLNKYQDDIDNYHRLMAILFRPITKTDKYKNYKISKYKGTSEHSETMKETPMNIVNGALLFFFNLANELEIATQKFITLERVKELQQLNTSKNGVGMLQ